MADLVSWLMIEPGWTVLASDGSEVGQVDDLGEYLEPATSAEIEADNRAGVGESLGAEARELEGKLFAPTQKREHSMNIWRRAAFFFRRLFRR